MCAKKKEKRKKQISEWGATGGHSPPSKPNISPPARHAKRAERGANNAPPIRAPLPNATTPRARARVFFLSYLRKNERSEALSLSLTPAPFLFYFKLISATHSNYFSNIVFNLSKHSNFILQKDGSHCLFNVRGLTSIRINLYF